MIRDRTGMGLGVQLIIDPQPHKSTMGEAEQRERSVRDLHIKRVRSEFNKKRRMRIMKRISFGVGLTGVALLLVYGVSDGGYLSQALDGFPWTRRETKPPKMATWQWGADEAPAGGQETQTRGGKTAAIEYAQSGFEVRFRGTDGKLIAEPKAIARQYKSNPFLGCLRDAKVAVMLLAAEQTGEPYVWAESPKPAPGCMGERKPWKALFDEAQGTVIVYVGTPAPPPADRTIHFVDPRGKALERLDGTIRVTAKEGGEDKEWLKAEFKRGQAIIPARLDAPPDAVLEVRPEEGYETPPPVALKDLLKDRTKPQIVVKRTPWLADLRFAPSYRLLGETVPADFLSSDKTCSLELKIEGRESRVPLTAARGGKALFEPPDRPRIPLGPETALTIIAKDTGKGPCLEAPKAVTRTDANGDNVVPFEVRLPRPWLLIVATSAQLLEIAATKNEQDDRRAEFWYKMLVDIDEAVTARPTPKQLDWHFVRLVEGSSTGMAERFLAGLNKAEDFTLKPQPILRTISPDSTNDLLDTPDKLDRGGGVMDSSALVNKVLAFADSNYKTTDGLFHTVLWIHGDGQFTAAGECERFGENAAQLEKKGVRLLEVVAAQRIIDSGGHPLSAAAPSPRVEEGWGGGSDRVRPGPALEDYSTRPEHVGVFVCKRRPEVLSELIVFDYPKAFGVGMRETPRAVLTDALNRFRTRPQPLEPTPVSIPPTPIGGPPVKPPDSPSDPGPVPPARPAPRPDGQTPPVLVQPAPAPGIGVPDPCVPPDADAVAAWTALGAPACMGSLDYLGCGIQQMGVEVGALAERFAPLTQQVTAWAATLPPCAEASPIDPLRLGLPALVKEVAAARGSLGNAQECLKEVDTWLSGGFHCSTRDCETPTDRAALAFMGKGSTLAHQQALEAAGHLDRLDTTAGAVTRLQQAYRVRCRAAAGRKVRE